MKPKRKLPPCVPDDAVKGGISWDDSLEATREDKAYAKAARDLNRRWARWLKAKAIIDADWKKDAERRLAAVTEEIERDKLLNDLEEELAADRAADAKVEIEYLNQLAQIIEKRKAAWLEAAKKRLARATAEINRDIVKREKLKFLGHT